MTLSNVKAVLFDVDGTLIDSNDFHAQAWARAMHHFGQQVPVERVREQIGKGADNLLPALLSQKFIDEHRQALEDHRAEIFERDYMDRIRPFPGVRPLFERIADAGIRIVLASSGTEDEVAHHLKLIECEDLVTATTSADDAERSKPDPGIFAAAMRKLPGVTADDSVMVGDSPYDMQAAKILGLVTIGVRCGGFMDDVLLSAGCDKLYHDPAGLLTGFDESPLGLNRSH